jgi:myosin light chain 6
MADLPSDKVEEAKQVFEVFDKKYESKVDSFYIGDMLRSLGLYATQAECEKRGQTKKTGEKTIKFEEFLPIYSEFYKMPAKNFGTHEDFMEGLKLFDKESNGLMSLAELTQVLVAMAEKLDPRVVEEILRSTNTKDDAEGMFNYEVFVRALLAGPFPNEST